MPEEDEEGKNEIGIRALFLYPMNALVNDQIDRIRKVLCSYPDIKYGFFTGDTKENSSNNFRKYLSEINECIIPDNELVSREEIRQNPPHLLFTNYSMLEYLMIRPNDFNIFNSQYTDHWQYVVLDEAHTYRGALGIEVALLLRRLSGLINKKLQYILTSATLGDQYNGILEIVIFVEALTSSKYYKEDIIFAKRVPLNPSLEQYTIEPSLYSSIVSRLDDIEAIKILVNRYGNFSNYSSVNEILYDVLIHDYNVYALYTLPEKY